MIHACDYHAKYRIIHSKSNTTRSRACTRISLFLVFGLRVQEALIGAYRAREIKVDEDCLSMLVALMQS